MSKRMGRPTLKVSVRRGEIVKMRVRPYEKRLLAERAKAAGQTVSDYLRANVFGELATP